jgi:hypothetical protein
MTMGEIQAVLDSLMRGIDKKTALTVEPRADADEPGVMVQLRRDKRTGSLQFTEADLFAAQTDLMRRNRVRTALKRARDRMWEETRYIFSTKVERPKVQGAAWFHPAQRGRGRRY